MTSFFALQINERFIDWVYIRHRLRIRRKRIRRLRIRRKRIRSLVLQVRRAEVVTK